MKSIDGDKGKMPRERKTSLLSWMWTCVRWYSLYLSLYTFQVALLCPVRTVVCKGKEVVEV